MKTGNSIFFIFCSCTVPFYVLLFHCRGLYLLASARIRPQRGMRSTHLSSTPWLSMGSSLFTAVKGGHGCGCGGCHRPGWPEQVPSTKFLPETTACLVTPLFLQIKIVYSLINKLYLDLAASHISTMEIISVWEKICLYVKQFWIKFLSLFKSWYGQNCTHVSCLPFRWELMYYSWCWNQLLLACCHLFSAASFVLTVADGSYRAGLLMVTYNNSYCFTLPLNSFIVLRTQNNCIEYFVLLSYWFNICSNTGRSVIVSGLSCGLQGHIKEFPVMGTLLFATTRMSLAQESCSLEPKGWRESFGEHYSSAEHCKKLKNCEG